MKLSCTRDNLHQALAITSHLTTKNVNLPILQNVHIKAQGGTIHFTSTNLEIAVHCTIRGKVESDGEATIPSKLFYDYVNLLPNETVSISGSGDHLSLECGTYKTKIHGLPAADFPLVPEVHGGVEFQIPVDDLRKALSRVLFASASNESRPELTGVCVNVQTGTNEGKLTLAATDSYRLAESVIPVVSPVKEEEEMQFIVPARTFSELNRILSVFRDDVESPSVVHLTVSEGQLVFRFGSVELISRTIEGNYPPYRQIIPAVFTTKVSIDREDFMKAVKTASLFSRVGLFDVHLEFRPEEQSLAVQATDATRGENVATCSVTIDGQKNGVTVNYRYLLDGLQAMDSEEVSFQMNDSANPCLIVPSTTSDFLYIVMPIKQ